MPSCYDPASPGTAYDDPQHQQRTLVLVKPDGVQRGLIGTVVSRIERAGLRLLALHLTHPGRAHYARHYSEHAGKEFFEPLLQFMVSGPVIALVAQGSGAVAAMRALAGRTEAVTAAPGSLRGQHSCHVRRRNVVHSSSSPGAAEEEIRLWFPALAPNSA